jgi:hypothetical protein
MANVIEQVSRAGANHERIAEAVLSQPERGADLLAGLQSDQARVKFGCAKVVRYLSKRQPALLYPHFDFFVRLLDSPNKILQWEGLGVLSHLAAVDVEDRFVAIWDRYFAPIPGPAMINAANAIRGGARVSRARPQ